MAHKRATNWTAPTDAATAHRRAGGRRRYNAQRALLAAYRRTQLVKLLDVHGGLLVRGAQAQIARELGVSRATICRDLTILQRRWQQGCDP